VGYRLPLDATEDERSTMETLLAGVRVGATGPDGST
jgi:hypothetical protein